MNFLILALATFRISSLIADEDGPMGLFEILRALVGVKRHQSGESYGLNNFARGLICQWCNSVWIGVVLTVAYMSYEQVTLWVCWPFALSTVTIILGRWVKNG